MQGISEIDHPVWTQAECELSIAQVEAAVMLTWWECRQRFDAAKIHEAALFRMTFNWPHNLPSVWLDTLNDPQGYRTFQASAFFKTLVQDIHQAIITGTYCPLPATTINKMKLPSLSTRSIQVKDYRDSIVYNVAILGCFKTIYNRLLWSKDRCSRGWLMITPDVIHDIERLSAFCVNDILSASYVPINRGGARADKTLMEVDLFRAYEMTNITLLTLRMQDAGCRACDIALIEQVARGQSLDGQHGIPISSIGSLVLYELMLDPIDRQLVDWGWDFTRHQLDTYVVAVPDDLTVATVMERLHNMFAAHGAYMNDAKTHVLPPLNPKAEIKPFTWLYGLGFQVTQWMSQRNAGSLMEPLAQLLRVLPGGNRCYHAFLLDWLCFDPYTAMHTLITRLIRHPRQWQALHTVFEAYMDRPDINMQMGKVNLLIGLQRMHQQWHQHQPVRAYQSVEGDYLA